MSRPPGTAGGPSRRGCGETESLRGVGGNPRQRCGLGNQSGTTPVGPASLRPDQRPKGTKAGPQREVCAATFTSGSHTTAGHEETQARSDRRRHAENAVLTHKDAFPSLTQKGNPEAQLDNPQGHRAQCDCARETPRGIRPTETRERWAAHKRLTQTLPPPPASSQPDPSSHRSTQRPSAPTPGHCGPGSHKVTQAGSQEGAAPSTEQTRRATPGHRSRPL